MTEEIKAEISTNCSYYKDVVKEEIIIDGVDVAGCNFRLERDNKQKCECCHATGFGVICDCEAWHNCYYKQLKRLEQENKEEKKAYNECMHYLACMVEQRNKLKFERFEQVKSKDRVRELGEVFTNKREINAMIDLIPNITIDMTFFEPSCGNGNFVVEIMKRKFDLCKKKSDYIRALESVIAIDIMADNIQECKQRIKELYFSYGQKENIDFILDTQIFQGNSLAIMKLLERN